MNARLTAIARRRSQLLARTAAQRDEVGQLVGRWHMPLAYVDRVVTLARSLRAHPLVLALGLAVLARTLPGGRLTLWSGRLWSGWRLYQSLHEQWTKDHA
ncbi:MAG: hypothetical protein HY942_09080 [Gammaproteobacteria bacterium]|nr:hypothetical protein [Gammaproteobacteria bacterium]